jgi:peptide/nickel transport system substrate-binding protein
MPDIRCPQCNALNRDTARYCAECGTPLLANVAHPTDRQTVSKDEAVAGMGEAPGNVAAERGERVLQGRYHIDQELGRGGFGAVYSAWDENLNHRCAVKENLETTAEAQRQFSREATILANLSHPNLPRVTDHFSIPNEGQYLVMDFVDGEDLESMLNRQGRLEVRQALGWAVQVADALVYLHGQHPPVLHRDIKPANIRITSDGRAMLVDFGLVKVFNPLLKTTMGARAVTPGYAPPEQYGQGRTDERTDIYALGATLYHLLTGREPLESVLRISGNSLIPLSEVNPQAPLQVQQVIGKALALEPGARFQTAAEFKSALLQCLTPEPVYVAPAVVQLAAQPLQAAKSELESPSVRSHAPQKATTGRKPNWMLIGAGIMIVGLLGIFTLGGLFFIVNPTVTRTPTVTHLAIASQPTRTASPMATQTRVEPTPPPVIRSKDPQTYVHLALQEPDTLDPALDYEVTGAGVLANVFDSLITYRRNDPNAFVPQLALNVPSMDNGGISPDGRTYRFKIRPGVHFHDGAPLTAEDVAYTFQRGLLQGGSDSPQWLFTEPLLGAGIYDVSALVDPALVDNPQALAKANPDQLVKACERVVAAVRVEGDEVVFTLAQPWSPFLSTLASVYGSILSRDWEIQNGAWDGDCASWPRYYAPTLGDINQKKIGASAMGTGPYIFDHWEAGKEIGLTANEAYWRNEPGWEGGPVGPPAIKHVFIREIEDFDTRLAQLEAGEADSIDLPENTDWAKMDRMVGRICRLDDRDCQDSQNPSGPLELIHGGPSVNRTDIFFNFAIDAPSDLDYLGSRKLDGNGIPPDFFANVHVRRAFAFCFNYMTYLDQYLQGEGVRTVDVMLPGMLGYDPNGPHFAFDPARCEDEFRQAEFDSRPVWEAGFKLVFPFPAGDQETQKIGQIFRDEMAARNPKFQIEVREIPSRDYFNQRYLHQLPIFPVGLFARYQNLPRELQARLGEFVTRGVSAVNPDERGQIYREFNQAYYENIPAILLFTDLDRHYQQRWVNGWFDNPVNPGLYFYVLSKD